MVNSMLVVKQNLQTTLGLSLMDRMALCRHDFWDIHPSWNDSVHNHYAWPHLSSCYSVSSQQLPIGELGSQQSSTNLHTLAGVHAILKVHE